MIGTFIAGFLFGEAVGLIIGAIITGKEWKRKHETRHKYFSHNDHDHYGHRNSPGGGTRV